MLVRSSTGRTHYVVERMARRRGAPSLPPVLGRVVACRHTWLHLTTPAGAGTASCGTCKRLRTAQWARLVKVAP